MTVYNIYPMETAIAISLALIVVLGTILLTRLNIKANKE